MIWHSIKRVAQAILLGLCMLLGLACGAGLTEPKPALAPFVLTASMPSSVALSACWVTLDFAQADSAYDINATSSGYYRVRSFSVQAWLGQPAVSDTVWMRPGTHTVFLTNGMDFARPLNVVVPGGLSSVCLA